MNGGETRQNIGGNYLEDGSMFTTVEFLAEDTWTNRTSSVVQIFIFVFIGKF